ncbi:SAM-dependent methyltransferase, partial [Streptomyces sp. NPDC000405]|uniref:SAM-dependent methyltransferase n=1 Tax=Streptomyces sp. NPDC000405 TaxID=3161033 RepID=UPI00398CE487
PSTVGACAGWARSGVRSSGVATRAASPSSRAAQKDVVRFFDGLDLIDPGVTVGHRWRPAADGAELPTDAQVSLWAGVGIKA